MSFHERARWSKPLEGVRLPTGYQAGASVEGRPEPFLVESELPGGGFRMLEAADDELPPSPAYEVEETARMLKAYHDIMYRLETSGVDTPLVNGHAPKTHDLNP